MNERRRRPGIVGPLILITIGVLLLLNQLGKLPWDLWLNVWRFWPVIFILIGVDILVSASRSTLLYILGLLLAIAVIGGIIAYAVLQAGPLAAGEPAAGTEAIQEALQGAASGRVTLRPGVARLRVAALADSPNFVEGEIQYGRDSLKVEKEYSVGGGQAVLTLRSGSRSTQFFRFGQQTSERWDLRFSPRLPLELIVNAGVGDMDLDLGALKVTRLELDAGVGSLNVTLPTDAGTTRASINAGVGSISVHIPSGVGARVHVSRGLGSVSIHSDRLIRSGNDYVSADYDTAENRVDLNVNGGVGSISID